jgi:hypothetical protein
MQNVKIYGWRTRGHKKAIEERFNLKLDADQNAWYGSLTDDQCRELKAFCERCQISYEMPSGQRHFIVRDTRDLYGVPMWKGYKVQTKREVRWVEERR